MNRRNLWTCMLLGIAVLAPGAASGQNWNLSGNTLDSSGYFLGSNDAASNGA